MKKLLLLTVVTGLMAQSTRIHPTPGLGDYTVPFSKGTSYRSEIQSPSEFLGFELGGRLITHREVMDYFEYLSDKAPNAKLNVYAHSYEGRELVYLAITSRKNFARLEVIRSDMDDLADLKVNNGKAETLIKELPAVAWLGYGIHGDELSSVDASVYLAYHLLAGQDRRTKRILDNTVVLIDPTQNPDGRMRFVKQMEQYNSVVPSGDIQSFHHRGVWPYGRGNHYLFDLNRDWFLLVHPETRGRVESILKWNPQFVLDCHEMGPYDTYLFSPPREPFNPFLPKESMKWWNLFAKEQAEEFDSKGWSYYTREWNEEMYPGYGSSWPMYLGAVGVLYEQAGVDGSRVKRPDGTVMTYRETVHHQFTSSMANLTTIASNRESLIRDYYEHRKRAAGGKSRREVFLFPPSENVSRFAKFASALTFQGIEVETAREPFRGRNLTGRDGTTVKEVNFPEGTLIVPLNQPNRNLVEAILTFEIRHGNEFLKRQRKARLKHGGTRLYDATGWSLALGYDVPAYFTSNMPAVKSGPYKAKSREGNVSGRKPKVGYAFSGSDDGAILAVSKLLDAGVKLWSSRKRFDVDGASFPRGSFLIRSNANPDLDERTLGEIARATGVTLKGLDFGLASSGPDLGGSEFVQLQRPKVALVGGETISTYSFGTIWHTLDTKVNMAASTLSSTALARTDLDKYNVLILPSASGGPTTYKRLLAEGGVKHLKEWIEDGGTLVAVGSAAAFVADTSVGLISVRQKRQVLEKLDEYSSALALAKEAESPSVDSLAVWEGKRPEGDEESADGAVSDVTKEADELARKLSPSGVIMRVNLDEEQWLSFGLGPDVPIMVRGSYSYVTKKSGSVAGRFGDYENVKLSGILWPEARERWAESVYSARESVGKGQVVMFATDPNFRGYFLGGERMLLNAVLLGPGFGTRQTVEF